MNCMQMWLPEQQVNGPKTDQVDLVSLVLSTSGDYDGLHVDRVKFKHFFF